MSDETERLRARARYRDHDCAKDRCDSDTRTAEQIEEEGYAAALSGATYADCPYGHRHPDVRFSPWQTGRWKALGEWCYAHGQPESWCSGNDDPDFGWEPAETACRTYASAATS